MAFNENTRVKIPAILHLTRLGYEYVSLKNAVWDENTNIFLNIFAESINRINRTQMSLNSNIQDVGNFYNKELNNYQWVQCWLLNLFIKTNYSEHVNKVLSKNIFLNKNQNSLSRATALLALSKHSGDFDLIFLKEAYRLENDILLKRAILASCSKMPRTYTEEMYKIDDNDELDIIVLKEYLKKSDYKIEMRV